MKVANVTSFILVRNIKFYNNSQIGYSKVSFLVWTNFFKELEFKNPFIIFISKSVLYIILLERFTKFHTNVGFSNLSNKPTSLSNTPLKLGKTNS
jgi:hypothetical protein